MFIGPLLSRINHELALFNLETIKLWLYQSYLNYNSRQSALIVHTITRIYKPFFCLFLPNNIILIFYFTISSLIISKMLILL